MWIDHFKINLEPLVLNSVKTLFMEWDNPAICKEIKVYIN